MFLGTSIQRLSQGPTSCFLQQFARATDGRPQAFDLVGEGLEVIPHRVGAAKVGDAR